MLNISHGMWCQKMSKNISLGRTLVSSCLKHTLFPPKACCNTSFLSFFPTDFSQCAGSSFKSDMFLSRLPGL